MASLREHAYVLRHVFSFAGMSLPVGPSAACGMFLPHVEGRCPGAGVVRRTVASGRPGRGRAHDLFGGARALPFTASMSFAEGDAVNFRCERCSHDKAVRFARR